MCSIYFLTSCECLFVLVICPFKCGVVRYKLENMGLVIRPNLHRNRGGVGEDNLKWEPDRTVTKKSLKSASKPLKTAGISANPKFNFLWGKEGPRIPQICAYGVGERLPVSPVFLVPLRLPTFKQLAPSSMVSGPTSLAQRIGLCAVFSPISPKPISPNPENLRLCPAPCDDVLSCVVLDRKFGLSLSLSEITLLFD